MRRYPCNVGNDGVLRYYIKVFVFLKPFERIRLTLSTFVNNVCFCTIKSFTYTYCIQTIELSILVIEITFSSYQKQKHLSTYTYLIAYSNKSI